MPRVRVFGLGLGLPGLPTGEEEFVRVGQGGFGEDFGQKEQKSGERLGRTEGGTEFFWSVL